MRLPIDEKITNTWNRRKYILSAGMICPDPASDTVENYNPFEHYEMATDDRKTDSPHLDFASLDYTSDEDIERFCSKWGVLGTNLHEFVLSRYSPNGTIDSLEQLPLIAVNMRRGYSCPQEYSMNFHGESVEAFRYYCKDFQFLMLIKDAIIPQADENKLKELYGHWLAEHKNTGLYITFDTEPENINEIGGLFASIFTMRIYNELNRSITPFPLFDNYPDIQTSWHSTSLLTSMYLMLHLDLTNRSIVRKCEKCQRWFQTKNKRAIYCKPKHQVSAKSNRYLSRNRRKE